MLGVRRDFVGGLSLLFLQTPRPAARPTQASLQRASGLQATGMHPAGIAAASSLLLGLAVLCAALRMDGAGG